MTPLMHDLTLVIIFALSALVGAHVTHNRKKYYARFIKFITRFTET